jgi:type I restriction enzyme M protein
LVCGAGLHRRRRLLARKSFLQHQRARHHSLPEQGEGEGPPGKLFLLNAATEFAEGDPKNHIPEEAITRIADTFKAWSEVEKYSRIVTRDEIAKNDFNISPSRYIHTAAGVEYRPIAEIVEELEALEAESRETDAALKKILARLGV